MRLLDAGAFQVLKDYLAKVVTSAINAPGLGNAVYNVSVLVHAQHPVGRDALHGERAGDADLASVLVRLVVQVLEASPGRD